MTCMLVSVFTTCYERAQNAFVVLSDAKKCLIKKSVHGHWCIIHVGITVKSYDLHFAEENHS